MSILCHNIQTVMNRFNLIYVAAMLVLTSCGTMQNISLSKFTKPDTNTGFVKKSVEIQEKPALKFMDDISVKPQSTVTNVVDEPIVEV